jgi:hypothetical protein
MINYTEIRSVDNPLLPNLQTQGWEMTMVQNIGWEDLDVVKCGFQYASGSSWIWRFGHSIGNQPIPTLLGRGATPAGVGRFERRSVTLHATRVRLVGRLQRFKGGRV